MAAVAPAAAANTNSSSKKAVAQRQSRFAALLAPQTLCASVLTWADWPRTRPVLMDTRRSMTSLSATSLVRPPRPRSAMLCQPHKYVS